MKFDIKTRRWILLLTAVTLSYDTFFPILDFEILGLSIRKLVAGALLATAAFSLLMGLISKQGGIL